MTPIGTGLGRCPPPMSICSQSRRFSRFHTLKLGIGRKHFLLWLFMRTLPISDQIISNLIPFPVIISSPQRNGFGFFSNQFSRCNGTILLHLARRCSHILPVPPSSSAPPPLPDDDDVITLKDKKTAYLMPTLVVLSARAGDTGRVLRDIFANTNRPESITSSKLKETINALLEHQSSFIYGSSTSGKALGWFWPLKGMAREEERKLRIEREYVYNYQLVPKLAPKQDKDYTVGVEVMWAYQDPLRIVECLIAIQI
ncbi:unnamed protein product [Linum tenue]|uniref:Uncharacterized protein n=1 Tax=Linum tenue TaxID=586396 RepID=A0AAV0L1I8_9ROSI|nr:unnamed protein product [Linum tenue]CAI0434733.1 unnamed protein product [Linum tenue]